MIISVVCDPELVWPQLSDLGDIFQKEPWSSGTYRQLRAQDGSQKSINRDFDQLHHQHGWFQSRVGLLLWLHSAGCGMGSRLSIYDAWKNMQEACFGLQLADAENISFVLGPTLFSYPSICTRIELFPSSLVTGLSGSFLILVNFLHQFLVEAGPSTSGGALNTLPPPSLSVDLQVKGLVLLILRQLIPYHTLKKQSLNLSFLSPL